MIDSAPILTALFTFSISISMSFQSLEIPRFTLILVLSIEPIAFGSIEVWSLLQGMITWPFAIYSINSLTSMFSFFAAISISFVIMPFLAASICVVYSMITVDSPFAFN